MNKGLAVLFLLLLSSFLSGQTSSGIEVSLDKAEIFLPCHSGIPAKYITCPNGTTINVQIKLPGRMQRAVKYEYLVTGGRIVGKGPKVIWNLSEARPGTYRITVRVFKGSVELTKSVPAQVDVGECPDCNAECLSCPNITIQTADIFVNRREIIELHTTESVDARFRWTVIGGTIIDGQGTDDIKVQIDGNLSADTVLVRVEVLEGGFCFEVGGCPRKSEVSLRVVKLWTSLPSLRK